MGDYFPLQFTINLHVLSTTFHCIFPFYYVILDMLTVRINNPHMPHFANPSNVENLFQALKFSIQADNYSKMRDVPCLDYW